MIDWELYDATMPSRAVVVRSPLGGAILWYVGADLAHSVQESGDSPDELPDAWSRDLGSAPMGVSVWEGRFRPVPPDDFTAVGEFRRPTPDELAAVVDGRCPWDPDDWRVPLA